MENQVIAPRVRAVENMVARARSKTGVDGTTPACMHCNIELWASFFFDGTNNHRERDFPRRHSNVAALFDAHVFDDDLGIRRFYYEGVGTEFAFEDRYVEQTMRHKGDEYTTSVSGYRESDNSYRQAIGRGIDIRLEKAMFDFEMFVRDWKARKRVDAINVAAFGFSRGAATARAFANWIASHSEVRRVGGALEFGGVPLRFRFLGIFDTVESIGVGSPNRLPHLVKTSIPAHVERCLHCTAAHELRPSFGLTGLGVGRYTQVVFPGAHSDVGGGYEDGDQGRTHLLSRIPMAQMLDHARGAGLKFLSVAEMQADEAWGEVFRHSFDLPGDVRSDLDGYMAHVAVRSGPMRDVFESHMQLYWQWLDSGHAALASANIFRAHHQGEHAAADGAGEVRKEMLQLLTLYRERARTDEGRGYGAIIGRPSHPPIPDAVPQPVARLFERYVHDSQAGFVLTGVMMKDANQVDYYRVRAIHAPAA